MEFKMTTEEKYRANVDELKSRLSEAYDEAVKRAERMEAAGGAGDEVSNAYARADAFSEALGWAEQVL